MRIAFPLRIDGVGRTATAAGRDDYIRGLMEQVLFTAPGERVNRPDFGSGLGQLVFAPNGGELAVATEFLVQGALQQWLGNLIIVEAVRVENEDAVLAITVQYVVRQDETRQTAQFRREV